MDAYPITGAAPPVYRVDLFSPDALRKPFEHFQAIRDIGPAVWLEQTEVFALGRFAQVRDALRSPDVLISAQGVGFNSLVNAESEGPPVIQRDGESHRQLRRVLQRPLMPAALKMHRAMLKGLVTERVVSLVGAGEFDAISQIAQLLPLEAVADLVGLSAGDREKMLAWATASFNAAGPLALDGSDDPALIADLELMMGVRAYLLGLNASSVRSGSWASSLFEAVERGELSLQDARSALVGFVLPSLDTTINAMGNLLHALATHPDEWRKLRADPALIPDAVLESMRFSPVVRWFSRVAAQDYRVEDIVIPAGARVMLLYGSANRDERHYPDANTFDIARNPVDQLAWGTGPHMCVGASLARMEMEVMLEALVEHVGAIEAGQPVIGTNRGLYGLDKLPLTLC